MNPTEGETQLAMEGAARRLYEEYRNETLAALEAAGDKTPVMTWVELDQEVRNHFLDGVNSATWAAITSLPDRFHPWRQLIDEVDTNNLAQLQDFHAMIRRTLDATP